MTIGLTVSRWEQKTILGACLSSFAQFAEQ